MVDEDDDVSSYDWGLMSRKRRGVKVGGERPIAIDLEEGHFIL